MGKDKKVWLIGAGEMASEYAKVLDELSYEYDVFGRGVSSAVSFEKKTGHNVITKGYDGKNMADYAIVAVSISSLMHVAVELSELGVGNILLEKPGGLNYEEIKKVKDIAVKSGTEIYVGYNRRFYSSVIRAKEIIEEDGGVQSFSFDFTEWAHVVEKLDLPAEEFSNWLLANSSHVIDLAFYLGGDPEEMMNYVSGQLPWYKYASSFSGAGKTKRGATFSYRADWCSAGRWSVNIFTKKHRLIFEPMEKLRIQNKGSVEIQEETINDDLDVRFKPGLYLQTKAFLNNDRASLLNISDHIERVKWYEKIQNP